MDKEQERTVVCKLCGKTFITIGHHVKVKHGVTIEQYLEMFPGSVINNDSYAERRKGSVIKSCTTQEFKAKMSEIGFECNGREERRKQSAEILTRLNTNPEFRKSGVEAWKKKLENPDFYEEHSEKLRQNAKKQWERDYDTLSKKVGPHTYKSEYFDKVFRSFAEKFLAEQLLFSKIDFDYEGHKFNYYCSEMGKIRKYIPDFYLKEYDLFIEVKYTVADVDKTVIEKLLAVKNSGKQIILVFQTDVTKSPSVVSYLLNDDIQGFIDRTNKLILSATTIESIA